MISMYSLMYTYKITLTFVGTKASSGHISCHASPVDNPVYDTGSTIITLGHIPQTTASVQYVNMSSSNTGRAEPIPKREFDNPIYGGNETDSNVYTVCLLYTSPSPRDATLSRMPSSA